MIAHYILKHAGRLAMGFMFLMLVGFTVENPPKQTSSSPIILAGKGQALVPIVISPDASSSLKETACDLKLYLDRITGASFRIEDGDGASGIVLGTLSQFPERRLQKDLEIRDGYDGKEAYVIRSSSNRLLLLGATDLGASHAAFRLLEHMGCRWFFPAKEWEVIPRITSLDVNLSESDRPIFLSRNVGYTAFDVRDKQNYLAWMRHNRVAESLTVRSWHTYPYILADNKAVFEAHPEYLALKKDGKRDSTNLCLSQPAVRKMAVQYALNWLKKHPADDMAPMDPSDGAGLCECEQCQSTFKTISNAAFGLANEVASAIAKQYPGKMVGIYAYASHSEPPDFSLNDNVYVTLTIGNFSSHDTFDEFVERWREKCKHFSSGYEYYSAVYDGCGRSFDTPGLPPGGRLANLKYLQESIRSYAANGSRIITGGRESDFGIHGIGNYVANRLMWNPKANVPALLEDFYAKAFGDAAPVMKRYYERFDSSRDPLISESFFALALRDLAEASRMVPSSPEIQARLNHLKIYLRYASLGWRMRHEVDDNRRRELCRQVYTIIYRQRYTGMVGWYRFQIELATLPDSLPKDRAWMTALPKEPYSDEEITREFAESLEQFQPDPVEEIAFSQKLVPVVLGESPSVVVRHNYYSRNIYSLPYTGASPVYVIHCLDD
ncbi:MAG: DUF4838 domain-containing protein, partial [Victivallales bacterium]